ncbi:hypothetical protein M422DRAFT_47177 [Sphaerobolus stellatus SS14]|uniref:WSC domain-containing protein n=1 Tax=Sphaerobolus stellatus (strain SS14) TaxID=990650 RepID=A0A0C9VCV2_SPHS4|nr:hypothetical protein M422DRAFT_47177 [Sphaerobolus stellatus SS14]
MIKAAMKLLPSLLFILSLALGLSAAKLPSGWTALGCFSLRKYISDNPGLRSIDLASYFDPIFSTQDSCIAFCDERNYPLAGAEFGRECYCGNQLMNNSTQTPLTDCNIPCPANSTTSCGGSSRLSLFSKNHGPTLVTQLPMTAGVWNYVGSFNNTTPNSQPLVVEAIIAGTTSTSGSVENCLSWCFNNFACPFCSVSDAGVCECGTALSPGRVPGSVGQAVCPRNTSEICGDTSLLLTVPASGKSISLP